MDIATVTAFLALAVQYQAKRDIDPHAARAIADELTRQIVSQPPPRIALSFELELERIVPLQFAAEMQSTSVDTLEREDARRVARGDASQMIDLSARRKGMRMKHALKLV